jgi:acylglycerol lipase
VHSSFGESAIGKTYTSELRSITEKVIVTGIALTLCSVFITTGAFAKSKKVSKKSRPTTVSTVSKASAKPVKKSALKKDRKIAAASMLSVLEPTLTSKPISKPILSGLSFTVPLDEQMGTFDGKLEYIPRLKDKDKQHGESVKLAAAVLRMHPVDAETPIAKLKFLGKMPFSDETDYDISDAPQWQLLESVSPSSPDAVDEAVKTEPVSGQPSFFVRPAPRQKLTRINNLFTPSFNKIGPEFETLTLPVREWLNPLMPARGVVVLVHGTTQHSGSFELFANHLSSLGFKVVSVDMRGHGRWYHSDGASDGENVNFRRTTQDLVVLLTHLKVKYPTLPVFCIGESSGGAVAVRAGGTNPDLLDGLVLVSPGTRPCVFNPAMVARDFVKGITHLNKLMDVTRYITRYSSDDNRVTNEMVSDPLSRTELTGKEVLQTGQFISTTPKFAEKLSKHISVLIVQGEEDRIVSPGSIKTIYKHIPSANKSVVLLPDCGHVLLGTSFLKPQVVSSISKWLVERSKERTSNLTNLSKKTTPHG